MCACEYERVIEKVKMIVVVDEVVESDVNNRVSETSRLGCRRNALLEECWGAVLQMGITQRQCLERGLVTV